MEELFAIEDFFHLFPGQGRIYLMIGIMIIAFYPILLAVRKLISPIVDKILSSRGEIYSALLKKHKIHQYVSHLFFSLYLIFWSEIFSQAELLTPAIINLKKIFLTIYSTIFVAASLSAAINIAVDIYKTKSVSSKFPIDLHAQIIKVGILGIAFLIILSNALNINISSLLTSLGAAAALLTFVFKDTVLGLLASLQLTYQDIIKVGDWITIPAYNADGDVESITITIVKIRNFDKTITTVPTYSLINGGVQNWQAMQDIGGRRIKRHININSDTITFCTQKMLDKIIKMPLCSAIAQHQPQLFIAENKITNLTIFRYYLEAYLKNHEMIYQQGFTSIVRQLQPTATGVPIELYVFTTTTEWKKYEAIQSDIFDHIYGVLTAFELKMFQHIESKSSITKSNYISQKI